MGLIWRHFAKSFATSIQLAWSLLRIQSMLGIDLDSVLFALGNADYLTLASVSQFWRGVYLLFFLLGTLIRNDLILRHWFSSLLFGPKELIGKLLRKFLHLWLATNALDFFFIRRTWDFFLFKDVILIVTDLLHLKVIVKSHEFLWLLWRTTNFPFESAFINLRY